MRWVTPFAHPGSNCRKCGAGETYLRWSTGECDNIDACNVRERVAMRRANARAARVAREMEVANG